MIQQAMRAAMVGKTVIAIAHRLSTVMDMDRLIVLQRGAIVADGTHAQLLQQGGLYAELWHRQSGEFNPAARHAPEHAAPQNPTVAAGAAELVVDHRAEPISVRQ
jgi:ATP-binding cassette subfamily B multidrug efflux pump